MNSLKYLFCCILTITSLVMVAQDKVSTEFLQDSLNIDSVHLDSQDFIVKLTKFIEKNSHQLDQISFLYIEYFRYNDRDSNLFFVSLKQENDIDNILSINYFSELGFFIFEDILVIVSFPKGNERLFFTQMKEKRTFFYKKKNIVKLNGGINSSTMGFEVKKVNDVMFNIKQLYYFKYPSSKLRKLYYKVFFRQYY